MVHRTAVGWSRDRCGVPVSAMTRGRRMLEGGAWLAVIGADRAFPVAKNKPGPGRGPTPKSLPPYEYRAGPSQRARPLLSGGTGGQAFSSLGLPVHRRPRCLSPYTHGGWHAGGSSHITEGQAFDSSLRRATEGQVFSAFDVLRNLEPTIQPGSSVAGMRSAPALKVGLWERHPECPGSHVQDGENQSVPEVPLRPLTITRPRTPKLAARDASETQNAPRGGWKRNSTRCFPADR